MSKKNTSPPRGKLVTEPDPDRWRSVWVQTYSDEYDEWLERTDYWPYGVTLKPGVHPDELREQIMPVLTQYGVQWQTDEVRFVEYLR